MRALQFSCTTRELHVVFGSGTIAEVGAHMDALGMPPAMLVTTPGRAREASLLRESLGHRMAGLNDGARPHVPAASVAAALHELRRTGARSIIALGGGSAIGLAKALALETGFPIAAVPTTYSGSEMTAIWGISDPDGKRTGRDPRVAPSLVVYDVLLTLELPVDVSAASGMNAMAHCVEALYAAGASPVSSLLAEDGIRRLARGLPTIVRAPGDMEARSDVFAGAHIAGHALDMSSMGLQHKLAHILGGSLGMPHAETHAALLPFVVAWNAPAAPRAMARVADALGAAEAAQGLFELAGELGVRGLDELGLTRKDIPKIAELAIASPYPNPRHPTSEGIRAILEGALAGDILLAAGT